MTRNIQNVPSRWPELHKPGTFSYLFIAESFTPTSEQEHPLRRSAMHLQSSTAHTPPTVVIPTTRERAERASGFNCDIKLLPKATTDLETTLWEEKQFCVGWTSQMLSGSRILACYVLAARQVSCYADTKKSKKIWNFVHNSFLPCPVNFKTGCSNCL